MRENEKKEKKGSASQRGEIRWSEMCGGNGWGRWGTCGPKNISPYTFFLTDWDITFFPSLKKIFLKIIHSKLRSLFFMHLIHIK